MRIMFNEDTVEEIIEIDASPAWNPNHGTSEDNPGMFSVSFHRFVTKDGLEDGLKEWDDVGEYLLDGTKETYEKAKANYKTICEKLLTQGYCRDTDFENFEWY